MTLIPASKRDKVQESTIDLVAKLDVNAWLATEPIYAGYDPFSGGWPLYGNLPGYMDGRGCRADKNAIGKGAGELKHLRAGRREEDRQVLRAD